MRGPWDTVLHGSLSTYCRALLLLAPSCALAAPKQGRQHIIERSQFLVIFPIEEQNEGFAVRRKALGLTRWTTGPVAATLHHVVEWTPAIF